MVIIRTRCPTHEPGTCSPSISTSPSGLKHPQDISRLRNCVVMSLGLCHADIVEPSEAPRRPVYPHQPNWAGYPYGEPRPSYGSKPTSSHRSRARRGVLLTRFARPTRLRIRRSVSPKPSRVSPLLVDIGTGLRLRST